MTSYENMICDNSFSKMLLKSFDEKKDKTILSQQVFKKNIFQFKRAYNFILFNFRFKL